VDFLDEDNHTTNPIFDYPKKLKDFITTLFFTNLFFLQVNILPNLIRFLNNE
jgi:hypothetical protein